MHLSRKEQKDRKQYTEEKGASQVCVLHQVAVDLSQWIQDKNALASKKRTEEKFYLFANVTEVDAKLFQKGRFTRKASAAKSFFPGYFREIKAGKVARV